MTTISELEALRAKAGVQEKSDALAALRDDFLLIWNAHRAYGYVSESERYAGVMADGEIVQSSKRSALELSALTKLCADSADAIRRDQSRAERIRAEVRAQKEAQ